MDKSYQMIAKVYGAGSAETIRIFLESVGIDVLVAQESTGKSIYPVTIGKMAQAKIFVRRDQAEEAMSLLRDMEEGKLISPEEFQLGDSEPEN